MKNSYVLIFLIILTALLSTNCSRIKDKIFGISASLEGNTFVGKISNANEGGGVFVSFFHNNYGAIAIPVPTFLKNVYMSSSETVAWKIDGDSLIFQPTKKGMLNDDEPKKSFYLDIVNDSHIKLTNKNRVYDLEKIIASKTDIEKSLIADKVTDPFFDDETFVATRIDIEEKKASNADKGLDFLVNSLFSSSIDLTFSFDKDGRGIMFGSVGKIPTTNLSMFSLPTEIFWGMKGDSLYVQPASSNKKEDILIYKILQKATREILLFQTKDGKEATIKLDKMANPYPWHFTRPN